MASPSYPWRQPRHVNSIVLRDTLIVVGLRRKISIRLVHCDIAVIDITSISNPSVMLEVSTLQQSYDPYKLCMIED